MSLKEALLDLLFPPKCPICGRSSDGEKDAPCPPCRQADFWISGPQAVVPGRAFVRCVCAGWYRGALKESMTRFKFQGCHRYALAYGPMLAEAIRTYLPGSYDCITWTPVSAARRRERGYDQAQLLAQATAEALGKQAVPLLTKVKDTKAQSALTDGRLRKSNVAGVYSVPPPRSGRKENFGHRRHPHHRRDPGGSGANAASCRGGASRGRSLLPDAKNLIQTPKPRHSLFRGNVAVSFGYTLGVVQMGKGEAQWRRDFAGTSPWTWAPRRCRWRSGGEASCWRSRPWWRWTAAREKF